MIADIHPGKHIKMKIVSVFNNKGGVGKTTLTFHVAHALGALGHRVLLMDLDPQCNLTIYALTMEALYHIWTKEDSYIDDFNSAKEMAEASGHYDDMLNNIRSMHFLLKPAEDGTAELDRLPPPADVGNNVLLLPGRLTLHLYEAKVAERWSGIYQGDPLAIRTATRIRELAKLYADQYNVDYVIFDTSPSLGSLNKNILTLADGFIVPCSPDLFSLYGIQNIGNALKVWKKQFDSIFHFLSDKKREAFPSRFVQFLGYTIYNAKKYTSNPPKNELNLAQAHYNYARQIPSTITKFIDPSSRQAIPDDEVNRSIGDKSVIYSHNTFPSMAQKYNKPMWLLPSYEGLDPEDKSPIGGQRFNYESTQAAYKKFAEDFLIRVASL